jgi:hypothetical protein
MITTFSVFGDLTFTNVVFNLIACLRSIEAFLFLLSFLFKRVTAMTLFYLRAAKISDFFMFANIFGLIS